MFCGNPNSRGRCVFDSFVWCWNYFPPVGLTCVALIGGLLHCLIVSCFVVIGLLEVCSSLKGNGNGGEMELEEKRNKEEPGRVKVRGTVVRKI